MSSTTHTPPPYPPPPLPALLRQVRACTLCTDQLPLGPRPLVQAAHSARLLIAGQAPGRKAHASGIPFDDASGQRLRHWLGLTPEQFYDPDLVALLPMGFCYPGTGSAGDLPPRPECAPTWRAALLAQLTQLRLTVVLGQYALAWHLPDAPRSISAAVADWQRHWPHTIALPHPSPRNNRWLKQHPWFEAEVLPMLRQHIASVLAESAKPK